MIARISMYTALSNMLACPANIWLSADDQVQALSAGTWGCEGENSAIPS